MITLEPVTPANYEPTLALAPTPAQAHLIAPVVKSLADAFVWSAPFRVARSGDAVIGYVMVFPFERDGAPVVNIVRFLIDGPRQGAGLGRALMDATLAWISTFEPRPRRIRISTFPENAVALALYRSCGFVDDGMEDGEVVLWLDPAAP